MKRPSAILGYTAAAATICAAILAPFLLYGTFTKAFASLGLHVDEMYSGGPKIRSIERAGYTIDVHRVVRPHLLQREQPFVQLDWRPAHSLPSHVDELVDIDGDGRPDVNVSFDVPQNPRAPLRADVAALNSRYAGLHSVGKQHFSALIVRVDDAILLRIPVVEK